MTRPELEALVEPVWRRHARRGAVVVAIIMGGALAGLVAVQSSSLTPTDRRRAAEAIGIGAMFVGLAGFAYIWGQIRRDCHRLGAVCPRCRQHLFARRQLLTGGPNIRTTGQCPHCAYQLVAGEPAVHAPIQTRAPVDTLSIQVIVTLIVSTVTLWLWHRLVK